MRWTVAFATCLALGAKSALALLPESAAPPLAGPGAPTAGASSAELAAACKTISKQLGWGKVESPGLLSFAYAKTTSKSWNNQQTWYKPACVVYPTVADDVAKAYGVIINGSLPYGIVGGSHSIYYGASSTPGILFDMNKMNKVEYDAQRGVAIVGPGNRWGRVYDKLAKYGQTVLGGRVADVGMGLLLIGGVSYLSGDHGFASTNFVEVELVLPTGELVVATPTNEYKDLLWALQAGSNAFGIVTEFTLKTIPVTTDFWGGLVFYAADQFEAISDAAVDFFTKSQDPKATVLPTFEWVGDGGLLKPFAIFAFVYAGPTPPPGLFDELLAIPHTQSTVRTRPYAGDPSGIVHLFDGLGDLYGADQTFRVQTHKMTRSTGRAALDVVRNLTATLPNDVLTFSLSFEHVYAQTVAVSDAAGGTPYGYPQEDLTSVLWNVANRGSLPTDRKQTLLKTLFGLVDAVPPTGSWPLYVPYASADQAPYATFGNLERLKAVRRKYDPAGFVKAHAGGPSF